MMDCGDAVLPWGESGVTRSVERSVAHRNTRGVITAAISTIPSTCLPRN
jgi:hypothetical protein